MGCTTCTGGSTRTRRCRSSTDYLQSQFSQGSSRRRRRGRRGGVGGIADAGRRHRVVPRALALFLCLLPALVRGAGEEIPAAAGDASRTVAAVDWSVAVDGDLNEWGPADCIALDPGGDRVGHRGRVFRLAGAGGGRLHLLGRRQPLRRRRRHRRPPRRRQGPSRKTQGARQAAARRTPCSSTITSRSSCAAPERTPG